MYFECYSKKAYNFYKFHWLRLMTTAMRTVIPSHAKDKNHIFTGYEIFVTGKILVFHPCIYKINLFKVNLACET